MNKVFVLGSAMTGLIFTRIQEGAQPGGLTQPQPGQTEPGIPYHVPSCGVPVGGAARWELTRGSGARGASPVRESGSVGSCGLFCVFPLSVSLLLLFPLFAVLLNCPYPNPLVSACFFPFSTPRRGEGQPRGTFVVAAAETKTVCQLIPSWLLIYLRIFL